MNAIATTPICKSGSQFRLAIILLLLLLLPVLANGQQGDLTCNALTPWIANTFVLTETHSSPGVSCWQGDGGCPGPNVPANVLNTSTSDFARGTIAVSGSLTLTVTDPTNDYSPGNFAGFRIASGLLDIGVLSSISISTLLNGVVQETVSSGSLLTVGVDLATDQFDIGFITTSTFDAIRITISNDLGLGQYDVYYAIMEDFCPGPDLECNVETALNEPDFPVSIDYVNTGSGGITIGEVLNAHNAISEDTADFASLINFAGIAGATFLTVEEQITNYPAGTFVGFDIQNFVVLGAGILSNITITTYLNDVQQESKTGLDLLIGASLLSGSGRQTVGFVTSTEVDKVRITLSQPIGLNLGTTRVYSPIFQEFCEGPPLNCNEITPITKPDYPLYIDGEHTGFTGVACALCNVINSGNVIDPNPDNWATIVVTAGVTSVGSLAVVDALAEYPEGTFTGFHIENPSLIDANVLTGITISTYLDGDFQESATNLDALITVGTGLLVGTGEQYVGFVTTLPFDEVKISLQNIVGTFNIGTTRIYSAIFESFCPTEIECDSTYYWVNPEFPVYVDAFLTGMDGLACVGCAVDDEQNVLTADTSDYATITIVADALGSGSIAVRDALYTYPAGTFAGYVIDDLGFLVEAELFESLIISTYLDGELQEFRSGNDLIDLAVLILFISADEGRYNVGFETTMPFDEIRITVGSVASVINQVRVYAAFTDTRSSNGGELSCLDGPTAVDDVAVTDEEVPVNIEVLENDSDSDSPLGFPVVTETPAHGDVVVHLDSTITYTPDTNFVGVDSFMYSICDDGTPALCDTATVVITVVPVIDTIERTITEDSLLVVCDDELTIFTEPSDNIFICAMPGNGSLTVNGDCVTYTPENEYTGEDIFCVYVCHPDDPELCDTTIVIVTITPVNDAPNAIDDIDSTDENQPVTIDVLQNDSDTDSPLGFPTIADPPANGMVAVNPDSTITYTPDSNFVGVDTFTYSICDAGTPVMCDTATVIIVVFPARDTIIIDIPIDSLPSVCISELTDLEDPVTIEICELPAEGELEIVDSCAVYTPDPLNENPDTMCVVVCDSIFCDTTIIIINPHCPDVVIRVFIEGPYNSGTQTMQTILNEYHVLPGQDPTESSNQGSQFFGIAAPPGQPYNTAPWNWNGDEGDRYGDGAGDISYDAAVTDWILVSIRENDSLPESEVWKCAGLLYNNGDVVFPEECDCTGAVTPDNQYYIVVEHRNHLPIMSTAITLVNDELSYDFTQNQSWIFFIGNIQIGEGQKLVGSNYVMYAANSEQINSRTDINASDDAQWLNDNSAIFQYRLGDHNMDGDVNATDEFVWLINNSTFTLIPF